MTGRIGFLAAAAMLTAAVGLSAGNGQGTGQPQGKGMGPGMGMAMMHGDDPAHQADMELIHFLLDNGSKMSRTVTELPDGVATVTETEDPALAAKIREHVGAMYRRLEDKKPIHMRDPLFRELFQNADKVTLRSEATEKGVKVTETSTDPRVATLIKAHAHVVSKFIENGRAEAMKNHAVPPGH